MFPSESIDLIVTSPPYNKKSSRRKTHKTDTWSGGNAAINYGDFNDNLPEETYQTLQVSIINECLHILKSRGSFFYNHKNRTVNKEIISPYLWLLKTNAKIKQEIIWNRKMIVEVDKVRFYPKTEKIFWLIKNNIQPKFNGDFAKLTEIWEILPCQNEKRHNHPAPFPEELVKNCILSTTNENDIIFDPYVGSGTTCSVAKTFKRQWIGIDISPEYCKIACTRLGIRDFVELEKTKTESHTTEKPIETKTAVVPSGLCSYKGSCNYKTTDGLCSYKKFCKERA